MNVAGAACHTVIPDAFLDHEFVSAFTESPDSFIGFEEIQVQLRCDAGEDRVDIMPALGSLRYVRDVPYEYDESGPVGFAPAYELAPDSPLLVFEYITRSQSGGSSAFIEPGRLISLPVDPHQPNHYLRLDVTAFSRGGQMQAMPIRSLGTISSTIGGATARHHLSIGFRFRAQTCAVVHPAVTLDDIDLEALQQQPTAAEKQFNIAVNCRAGGRPLTLEMVDVHDRSNRGSVLSPAPGSTASGVALQLLHQGGPLQLGAPWVHGNTQGGSQSIPFSAQYLRTAEPLQPGAVLGEATLLATYE